MEQCEISSFTDILCVNLRTLFVRSDSGGGLVHSDVAAHTVNVVFGAY